MWKLRFVKKNEPRNIKTNWLIEWVIMHMFDETNLLKPTKTTNLGSNSSVEPIGARDFFCLFEYRLIYRKAIVSGPFKGNDTCRHIFITQMGPVCGNVMG